ncbi:MAG TPA: sigma-70 family RNA polymerase sigma factor [Gemmataceae bacterium]|nr:sigma-70 family RNA polymerase sigma factor [Gemmataceae bacterium]
MASAQLDTILRQARRLGGPELGALTDRQLLARFATQRDEAAFALLVARHGAMVLGVCRRLLRHEQDTEDAFQAVFLVLARRAGSVGWQESVGGWLYEVAHRVAAKALSGAAQRRTREREAAAMRTEWTDAEDVSEDATGPAHEELRRLPEKYRLPVVLCYLEGKSHTEAAVQLGWPLGTVKGRLARARVLLRRRLARRGVVLSVAGLVTLLSQTAGAALPPVLAHTATRAALAFATGLAPSPPSSLLACEVLRTMFAARLRLGALLVLTLGLLCGGTVLIARPHWKTDNRNRECPINRRAPSPKKKLRAPWRTSRCRRERCCDWARCDRSGRAGA